MDAETVAEHGAPEPKSALHAPDRNAAREGAKTDTLSFLAAMRAKQGDAPAKPEPKSAAEPAVKPDEPEERVEPEEPAVEPEAEPAEEPAEEPEEAPAAKVEPEPEEPKPDPELTRRLAKIQRQEEHARQQIQRERAAMQQEREQWQAQQRAFSAELEEFKALKARAKYDPAAVLAKLGLGDEDWEVAARAVFARSPAALKDPNNRTNAEAMMRQREKDDEVARLQKRVDEIDQREARQKQAEENARAAEQYLDGIKRGAGFVKNRRGEVQIDEKTAASFPLAAHFLAKGGASSQRTEQRLGAIAMELAQRDGVLPDPSDVLEEYEERRREELEDDGYDVATILAKPAWRKGAAAPAKPAATAPAPTAKPTPAKPIAKPAAKPANGETKAKTNEERKEEVVDFLAQKRKESEAKAREKAAAATAKH